MTKLNRSAEGFEYRIRRQSWNGTSDNLYMWVVAKMFDYIRINKVTTIAELKTALEEVAKSHQKTHRRSGAVHISTWSDGKTDLLGINNEKHWLNSPGLVIWKVGN